jgi:uncharacterized protein (DUF58 family)
VTLQELYSTIREIEITSKKLSNQIFSGAYRAAYKGTGMSFSEVRAYNYGDDVRNIDWNVSARMGDTYSKIFEEDKERYIMLLVDISPSMKIGSQSQSKQILATKIAALLAFSALKNNDLVGAIFFSNGVEKIIPPKKGRGHILYILRLMLSMESKPNGGTNIQAALQSFLQTQKKKCLAFLISDFYAGHYKALLPQLSSKHEFTAIHVFDNIEVSMPSIGILPMQDAETGEVFYINTKANQSQSKDFSNHAAAIKNNFTSAGAYYLPIGTHEDFINKLLAFFTS